MDQAAFSAHSVRLRPTRTNSGQHGPTRTAGSSTPVDSVLAASGRRTSTMARIETMDHATPTIAVERARSARRSGRRLGAVVMVELACLVLPGMALSQSAVGWGDNQW